MNGFPLTPRRRATLIGAVSLALCIVLGGCLGALAQSNQGDSAYQPKIGQPGKNVVWIPTPDALVTRMLEAAKVTKDDLVYDLGSGDGRIPIAAAKQFGARAVGIEYNADMASFARREVERAGLKDTVKIVTGDIFETDFSRATVVTMYLLPALNLKLRPTILKMKPGTRVTSHQFGMGDWEPDEHFKVEFRDAYLWYVPANVAGEWVLRDDSGYFEARITLSQRYQKVGGTVLLGGKTQPLLAPALRGDRLSFSLTDDADNVGAAVLTASGGAMSGEIAWADRTVKVSAQRRAAARSAR